MESAQHRHLVGRGVGPKHHVEPIAAAGGDRFTFHLEATDDPGRLLETVRAAGLQVGIAANPDTAIGGLSEAASRADVALCMGVHPGLSGQQFLPRTVERVAHLRRICPMAVRIQVDGGIRENNVADLRATGADLCVGGSSIFQDGHPADRYQKLSDRSRNRSVSE